MPHSSDEVTGAPHVGAEEERYPAKTVVMEDQRFTVKAVYDYLRSKGKAVPTGKPQVVGHKVDISGLAKAAFEAGGKAQVSLCSPISYETVHFRLLLLDSFMHECVSKACVGWVSVRFSGRLSTVHFSSLPARDSARAGQGEGIGAAQKIVRPNFG